MIPATEGPDQARLHSQIFDAIDVSDHIVEAQGQIVQVFERYRELLPACNGPGCRNFDGPRSSGRATTDRFGCLNQTCFPAAT
jgi:hypothetical protein